MCSRRLRRRLTGCVSEARRLCDQSCALNDVLPTFRDIACFDMATALRQTCVWCRGTSRGLPRLSARGSGLSPCSKILREMVRPPGIPPEDCGASTFLSSEGLDDRLRNGLEPRTWTFRSDALPAGTGPFEQYR